MLRAFALLIAVLVALPMGAVSITNNGAPLAFGSLIALGSPGTATVSPAGARTTTGVFGFGAAGYGSATFTVTVPKGNPHFTVILPSSITVTGAAGAAMTIDTFQSQPAGGGSVDAKTNTATVAVGATLHVGAAQPPGAYAGTFDVTVTTP